MGWGTCGPDEMGRPMGYQWTSICDYPGCDEVIDRGLAFVCGGMHGADDDGCGRYYCDQHLAIQLDGPSPLCPFCAKGEPLPPIDPGTLIAEIKRLERLYAWACGLLPVGAEPPHELFPLGDVRVDAALNEEV